ncbi:DUF7601 domain-containing protein [Faecalibacterium prausnitzii]|uniref:DUF7601 domain-containing protein n=1 Tax=Faecalibacterium prausnitzii TaxID=853 RepID=UPI0012E12DFB|nr:Ig-like domain-containing protein [Faecalibacterium prausnitzii]
MRKNHHGKKDRLVKRVFALCLALAVICTCLVPVFATEGLIDPQVNQEASRPVDDGEASYPDDEVAGFGGDEAAGFGEPREVYDDSEAAGFGGEEATRPVEGGEDNLDGGPSVKETEWGTVIEYGPSSSTDPSSSTETQWSGEDDVVEKPDDKVVVSGDEIKKLQDMVVYRFWLKELNANDLQDITAQAQINNMTESEYLARNGEVLWNLYFIQAVPRAETIADYSSYIENPSSNRDPKGELRLFDYWYTLDEFGNRVRLNLTDPTSNILDDKTTTVNVYAAWKDGTVGSDEEEKVDHEDLVDKNPVPVDLTAKASASYEDEDGELKTTTLPVEVKNLPSAADHLNVIHMGDDDMESFYESHEDSFGEMMPILGLKISPKNAKGEKVQLAKGEKATVTVSGLEKLPEMEGATASTLKVLHETSDGNVEILDVLTYTNGTLTFETSSFSPFVLVRTDGYDAELLDERVSDPITIIVGKDKTINDWWTSSYKKHSWESSDPSVATVSDSKSSTATVTGKSVGEATITHTYGKNDRTETYKVIVKDWYEEAGLFILYSPTGTPDSNADSEWTSIVQVGGENAKLGSLEGAIWDSKQKNIFFRDNGGADGDNAKQYIKYWPDGVQYDGPRVLDPKNPKNPKDSAFRQVTVNGTTLEKLILQQYKSDLKVKYKNKGFNGEKVDDLVDKLEANQITITITPHKISKNVPKPQMHIDCTVTVTCKLGFTAVFNEKTSAVGGYTVFDRDVYLWDKDNLTNNTVTKCSTVPKGYTDGNGVQWEFDGWCLEDVDTGNEPGENAGVISDDDWKHYIVNEDVLKNHGDDRVVNFYAHYKPATSNVTITKQVTGLLGDTNKEFAFNVSITQNNAACTGVTAKKGDQMVSLTDFTLKHNETVTLENVPIGATITVKESAPGEHYTVYSTGYSDGQNGGRDVTFTYGAVANTATASDADEADLMLLSMDEDTAVDTDAVALADATDKTVPNNAITVTNHCTLFPDTGVLLDTLPYIVILAVVAGGVALLMLRKRRKEDD